MSKAPEHTTWVTVAIFNQVIEAHMARGRLEAEGIECRLVNEHFLNVHPLCAPVVGGVKLSVAADDEAQALSALRAELVSESDLEAMAMRSPTPHQPQPMLVPRCPACGAEQRDPLLLRLRRWLAGAPPAPSEGPWRCARCAHSWSGEARPQPILKLL